MKKIKKNINQEDKKNINQDDKKNINQEEEINDIVRNQESKKFRAPKKEEEKIMKKMEVLDEIELEDNDEGEMTMEEEIKIREAEKKINLESEDRINRNEKNPELSSNLTHIVDIPKPHYKILIGVLPTRSVDIILHNISLQDDINIAGIEVFDDKINGQERLNCFIYLESIQSAEDFINRHKLFGVIIEGRRCPVESVEKKKSLYVKVVSNHRDSIEFTNNHEMEKFFTKFGVQGIKSIKQNRDSEGYALNSFFIEFESHDDADISRIRLIELKDLSIQISKVGWSVNSSLSFRSVDSRNKSLTQENNALKAMILRKTDSINSIIKQSNELPGFIEAIIKQCNYDKKAAAKILNISPYSLMKIISDLKKNGANISMPESMELDFSFLEGSTKYQKKNRKKKEENIGGKSEALMLK